VSGRYLFAVIGGAYQEKLTRQHCVAGMEARLESPSSIPASGGPLVVKVYFRFRQRWESIGHVSAPLPETLARRLTEEGALPACLAQVTPGRGGDPQISVSIATSAILPSYSQPRPIGSPRPNSTA